MNKKSSSEINSAINALPICNDGKAKVRDLVEALGFKIQPEMKAGQVWKSYGATVLLVNPSGMLAGIMPDSHYNLFGVTLFGGGWSSNMQPEDGTELLANSLEEYFNKKAAGTL